MNELIVSAVNDEEVLRQNLLLSPAVVKEDVPIRVYLGQPSAAHAYNLALAETTADVVVLAHQDVYLPHTFFERLREAINLLIGPNESWAVLGVFGASADGTLLGHVWSSGLNRELGQFFATPLPIVSLDEVVLVVRRSSGLQFDEGLPGFHLYGTDIVQAALSRGFGAYVVHAPVIHNSNPVVSLGKDYWRAYRHLAWRWRDRLPIPTSVLPVMGGRWPEIRYRVHGHKQWLLRRRPPGGRQQDPGAIATRLGY